MRKASPRLKNESSTIAIEQLLDPTASKDSSKATCATSGADEDRQLSSSDQMNTDPKNKEESEREVSLVSTSSSPGGQHHAATEPTAHANTEQVIKEKKGESFDAKPSKLAILRKLAQQPGKRLSNEVHGEIVELLDQHKQATSQCASSSQILGKRQRGKQSERQAYKRLCSMVSQDVEFGQKCHTPLIFEKTLQMPPILAGIGTNLTHAGSAVPGGTALTSKLLDQTVSPAVPSAPIIKQPVVAVIKPAPTNFSLPKKLPVQVPARVEESGLWDYDLNLSGSQIETQKNQTKCFENYLDLMNLTYFGPTQGAQTGKKASENGQNTVTDTLLTEQKGFNLVNSEAAADSVPDARQKPVSKVDQNSLLLQQRHSQQARTSNFVNFSHLDYLINPLRSDHPFELWSPKEIALFTALICQFGKHFEHFVPFIKTKSLKEINDFYRCWKSTKYYRTWKQKNKDRPKPLPNSQSSQNPTTLTDLIFHDRPPF